MKCDKCNQEIKEDSKFCSYCGTKVEVKRKEPDYDLIMKNLSSIGQELRVLRAFIASNLKLTKEYKKFLDSDKCKKVLLDYKGEMSKAGF